jgi:hypothetical protein
MVKKKGNITNIKALPKDERVGIVNELLKELDMARHMSDAKGLAEIEEKLNKIRFSFTHEGDGSEDGKENDVFVPYPELSDKGFLKKIYKKKEFHKNEYTMVDKTLSFDDHARERCNMQTFRLSKNQVFLKNFMSPQTPFNSILLFHGVGVGKCHGKDTPILMFDGSIRRVQDIHIGDIVMGDDSLPRRVLNTVSGQDHMFTVIPTKGENYTCNSEHILCLKYKKRGAVKSSKSPGGMSYVATYLNKHTLKMASKFFSTLEDANAYLDAVALEGTTVEVSVRKFLSLPKSLKNKLKGYKSDAVQFGGHVPGPTHSTTLDDAYNTGAKIVTVKNTQSNRAQTMMTMSISGIEERKHLLAGIVDCGLVTHKGILIHANDEDEVLSILFLCRSLGLAAYKHSKPLFVHVSGDGLNELPLRDQCKKSYASKQIGSKDARVTGIKVVPLGNGEYYGFMTSGNHRYLLGDFTVTHNSCSAISIAEQFKGTYKKKALVLMPTSLKGNFKKQIFDINKLYQCTGNKYRDQVPDRNMIKPEVLERRVDKLINDSYEFMGFMEFAIAIENLENAYKARNVAKYISKIKDLFSDRVIIIDEVHNVRKGKDESKKVPPRLMEVLRIAEHSKLVLLTATPMYNEATEIVWLVNLLLANDKRPLLKQDDMFDANKMLTESGKGVLEEYTRGYVSYMRGENPFAFPFRLYPSDNHDTNILKDVPTHDNKGNKIKSRNRLQQLELIQSEMSTYQQKIYERAESGVNEDDQEDEDDMDTSKNANTQLLQISNIIYPAVNQTNIKDLYGRGGFSSCFNVIQSQTFKVEYKNEILDKFGEFLAHDKIGTYAPKFKRIIDYISSSEGLVLVYSFFKEAGVIPLAIALEHIGFNKFNGNNYLHNRVNKKPFLINGKQATYIVLTPDKPYTPDFDGEIQKARHESNNNGEVIKVVLGTSVAVEGIDFKFIREIHMIEPWYHLNKVAQILGRAVRNCSHINIEPSKRNVTMYHHVNVIDDRQSETIDTRIYRIAENKQIAMQEVEMLLKMNSIDCSLNRHALYFNPKYLKMKLNIVTSQGTLMKNYKVGDHDRHNSQHEFICKYDPGTDDIETDNSTFDISFYHDDIDVYASFVSLLFRENHAFGLADISVKMSETYGMIDQDILHFALEYMLNTKYQVHHQKTPGFLIYRGSRYMFQPIDTVDIRLTNKSRMSYKKYTQERIEIGKDIKTEMQPIPILNKEKEKGKGKGKHVQSSRNSPGTNNTTVIQPLYNAAMPQLEDPMKMLDMLVESHIKKELMITKDEAKKLTQELYDYTIDRLGPRELLLICTFLMNRNVSSFSKPEKMVAKSLEEGHILIKDTHDPSSFKWMRNIFEALGTKNTADDDTIDMYIYLKNVSGMLQKASPVELQEFNANQHADIEVGFELTDLKGVVAISEDASGWSTRFKVVDSAKPNSKGSVCHANSQFKYEEVVSAIKAMDGDIIIGEKKKPTLCNLYELLLRALNRQYKTIARPFEVIASARKKTKKKTTTKIASKTAKENGLKSKGKI